MRTSLISATIAFAAIVPTVSTASAAYYLDRYEDGQITRYGGPDWYSNTFYDEGIYTSPYRTKTHALHPYYRNSYNELRERDRFVKNTRPEFYRYLEDLYYDGQLGGSVPYTPAPRCYNYSTYSPSQWSPRTPTYCN